MQLPKNNDRFGQDLGHSRWVLSFGSEGDNEFY